MQTIPSRPISKGPNPKPPVVLPPLPVRERILVYGKEGSGKTRGWISAARRWKNAQFFVLDTDDAVARMLEREPLSNVHTYIPDGWKQFDSMVDDAIDRCVDIVRNLKAPVRKEDLPWIVVDFADTTWDMVQNYYVEEVFDQGIDDFFLQARQQQANKKNAKQLQPLEGWTDWQVINKIYQTRWNGLTKGGGPFHIYLTAKAVDLGTDAESVTLYKSLKKAAGGEKRMGGRVHTVMMSSVGLNDTTQAVEWYLSTAKDRERTIQRFNPITDFSLGYLIKIAGWEPF